MSTPSENMPLEFAKINDPNWHMHVMWLINALGLKLDDGGFCHGVARTAQFAFLRGDKALQGFIDSVAAVDALQVDDIPRIEKEIEAVQNQLQLDLQELEQKKLAQARPSNSSEDEIQFKQNLRNDTDFIKLRKDAEETRQQIPGYQNYIDSRAFLENVKINHRVSQYDYLLSEKTEVRWQLDNLEDAAHITQPNNAKTEDRIVQCKSDVRPYRIDQLDEKLMNLKDAADKVGGRIGAIIASPIHAITCNYDPMSKKWLLVDSNQQPLYAACDLKEVSEFIWKGLHIKEYKNDEHVIANFQVITIQGVQERLSKNEEILEKLIIPYETQEASQLPVKILINWLEAAVTNGDLKAVIFLTGKEMLAKFEGKDISKVFYMAAGAGRLDIIKYLFNKQEIMSNPGLRIDINEKNEKGVTALMWACGSGYVKVIEYLIENKADLYIKGKANWTALSMAAYYGHVNAVKALLNKGFEIKTEIKITSSPLYLAAEAGQADMVEILLEHGYDFKDEDERGISTFAIMVNENHTGAFEKLFASERIKDLMKEYGPYLLYISADLNKPDIAQLLFSHGIVSGENASAEGAPLCMALEDGNIDMAKMFIENGVSLDEINEDGKSAIDLVVETQNDDLLYWVLQYAVKNDKPILFDKLLDHPGVNKTLAREGLYLLFLATTFGRNDIGHSLFKRGLVKPGACSSATYPTLSAAVKYGHNDMALTLLKNGANVFERDREGKSALMWAIETNNLVLLDALLEDKNNVETLKEEGEVPYLLCSAAYCGNSEVIEALFKHGVATDIISTQEYVPLCVASKNNFTSVVETLLHHGADADAKDQDDQTPLEYAISNNEPGIVQLLLKAGAKADAIGKDNFTPLSLAAYHNKQEIAEELLNGGADANFVNEQGISALWMAASLGNTEMVELLLKHGANPNLANKNGLTPAQAAQKNDHPEVIAVIDQHQKTENKETIHDDNKGLRLR